MFALRAPHQGWQASLQVPEQVTAPLWCTPPIHKVGSRGGGGGKPSAYRGLFLILIYEWDGPGVIPRDWRGLGMPAALAKGAPQWLSPVLLHTPIFQEEPEIQPSDGIFHI